MTIPRRFKRLLPTALLLVLSALTGVFAFAAEEEDESPPASLEELEQRIRDVLSETKTPGIGIVLVSRDDVLWLAGVGMADVASGREATADTLFRIGSTSKGFVALSVLKLQEAGRLSLDDTLRERAPEIEFTNRWEETDPVRIVHLLEHTAGFDDIHLAEYASNDPTPLTVKQGLDLHPDSRTSRWRPGTRMSYCNSGPAVAAYVVEKVAGRPFEEYVEETFFAPLGMRDASYFLSPEVVERGATLYADDGVTPNPYWHISMRPSGSINASARDMAGYVRMYLGRGELDGVRLLSRESIERMERATTAWGAREGIGSGYGLANYVSGTKGFVWHGHNGGVNGGLTEMAYLPDHGIGYAFMINSGSGAAFGRISDLVRGYLTKDLPAPELPPAVAVPGELAASYAGIYEPNSPRAELQRVFDRLGGLVRLRIEGESLATAPLLGGEAQEYVAVSERLARRTERPVTSLALISDTAEGTFVAAGGQTYRKIPAWLAWGRLATLAVVVLLMLSSVAFALVWLPRVAFGKLRGAPGLSVRVWPLVAVLALAGFLAAFLLGMSDAIARLGALTGYAVGQWFLSLLFGVLSFWALATALRARKLEIHRVAWWHSTVVAVACCVATVYLLSYGMIGFRSWSY